MRKPEAIPLGPRYSGTRISRVDLPEEAESDNDPFGSGTSRHDSTEDGMSAEDQGEDFVNPDDIDMDTQEMDNDEDIDSDEAFGNGDEAVFKGFTFRGSKASGSEQNGSIIHDDLPDADHEESSEEDRHKFLGDTDSEFSGFEGDTMDTSTHDELQSQSDGSSVDTDSEMAGRESSNSMQEVNDRAALRKMMADEQKTVLASISEATAADAAKGRAVNQQRHAFSSLLNIRIHLQKALVATNSMSLSPPSSVNPVLAAESAALSLWTQLSSLRASLDTETLPTEPLASDIATSSTPTLTLHKQMRAYHNAALSRHRTVLDKWAAKTHLASSLPTHNRLTKNPTHQPLTSILDSHLLAPNINRLLARTRIPRSCAPLQAQTSSAHEEDNTIFDDADFYTLLLRELVDQKMISSGTVNGVSATNSAVSPHGGTPGIRDLRREAKTKKKVDTKASKGRKMRYTVHEKLQNFMAREDRGRWGERQVDELFGGLLGRKVVGGLSEDVVDGVGDGDGDDDRAAEGLRLFRGGLDR